MEAARAAAAAEAARREKIVDDELNILPISSHVRDIQPTGAGGADGGQAPL